MKIEISDVKEKMKHYQLGLLIKQFAGNKV